MNLTIMMKMMKKSICLLAALCLIPIYVPEAKAAMGVFEEIQLLKGDVFSIPAKSLQRVSITDPTIVDISDAKPEEVIIVGQQVGQAVLFLWDENGKRSYIIRVILEDLGLTKARIKTILATAGVQGVTVEQNDLEGKVMLSGSVSEEKLETVIKTADSFPGSVLNFVTKEDVEDMIQIDMQITELSTTLNKAMGVQWSTNGVGETLGPFTPTAEESNVPQTGKIQDILKLGDFNRVGTIMAHVNMLISEGKGRVLSKPRLVVRSGKEAMLQVGGEVPITTVTSDSSGTQITQNTTFKPYGISLGITPTIKNHKIDILLNTEISDIDASTALLISSNLAFITRSAQTQVLLNDKQAIVLAGLIKKHQSETKDRVPFFGKIPVLGVLFRNTSSPADKDTEVVISLTATILKSAAVFPEQGSVVKRVEPKPAAAKYSVDEKLVMESGRNESKKPVITKNAANVPVTIPGNLQPYANVIQQKVSSGIAYPYEAQENGWQGTVKLGMVIRKDGSLRDVFVKESSGYDVFDQDAVNTAQILAPYASFPATIAQEEITVTLPIVYSLDAFLKNVAK